MSKEGGCCSVSQLCFATGDFDRNYSPWKNENRRKRVNALVTEKRDSMYKYIDCHRRVESYLEGVIWRACQKGKEVNPTSTKLQIAGHPAGIRIHWQHVAVGNPAIGRLLSQRASEFANVNHPWDLKARCISCVFTRTLPCQAVCLLNPALTDG